MNEAQSIARARHGEEAAWVALVRQHQDAVFRLAYLLLGDADDANDVAQETFIRAFRSLEQFDDERPLRPWLLQIARNLARNRQRAAGRYLAALRRWFDADRAPTPTRVEALTARQMEAERLWQAIARLKVQDQEVIYLRYFLELSVADTASTLGVADGTVKSRLSRALERLQRTIETDFPDLHPGFSAHGQGEHQQDGGPQESAADGKEHAHEQ